MSPYVCGDFTTPDWLPISVSVIAVLSSGLCVAICSSLVKRSPPGIVARAAGELEAHQADVDARVRRLETNFQQLEIHVDSTLEANEKAASDAKKRNAAARRAQQAAESAAGGGAANGGLDQWPVGSPQRIAAIERLARERGY